MTDKKTKAELDAEAQALVDQQNKDKEAAAKAKAAAKEPTGPTTGPAIIPSAESREQGKRAAEVNERIAREERNPSLKAGAAPREINEVIGVDGEGQIIDDTAEGRRRVNLEILAQLKSLRRYAEDLNTKLNALVEEVSHKADAAGMSELQVQLANNGEARLTDLEKQVNEIANEVRTMSSAVKSLGSQTGGKT